MKILALNGGGSLGYITALFLRELEETIDKPLYEIFDMVAGVSTGSLISAAIATGKSAHEICQFYEQWIPKIFGKSRTMFTRLWKPKYNNDELKASVKSVFGEKTISETFTKLMVSAVQLTGKDVHPKFWKSWEDSEILADCLVASCSAPTFFEPYNIGEDYFIDGGLATNNLSMCAVADAIRLGNDPKNIKVLNIAAVGRSVYKADVVKNMRGLKHWAVDAIGVATMSSEPLAYYQITNVVGLQNSMLVQSNARYMLDEIDLKNLTIEAKKLFPKIAIAKQFLCT